MECHDSSAFLIRKLPLSITEALLKSMAMDNKSEKVFRHPFELSCQVGHSCLGSQPQYIETEI